MAAQRALLADGRLHLNHGPIDLVIEAFGSAEEVALAYDQAWTRFPGVLPELTAELKTLRSPIGAAKPVLSGPIAKSMAAAVWPYRAQFITPMAAVAGAVAEEILSAMIAGRDLAKAYVNNGGDIALHLTLGESFKAGIVGDLESPGIDARAAIGAESPIRGIATSGRGGRSFSLGVADAVTIFARSAAEADAAATIVANAVNIDDPAIRREPASSLDPDSDLGDTPVTVDVGLLAREAITRALDAGVAKAERLRQDGLIEAAVLQLRGERRVVSDEDRRPEIPFDSGGHPSRRWPEARASAQARGRAGGYP